MNSSAATGRYPAGGTSTLPEGARRSHALESLTGYLAAEPSLHIIDFGGINQSNLDFVTDLGHRFYSEDLLRAFDAFFAAEEISSGEYADNRIAEFLDATLAFGDEAANASLLWDTLQFLPAKVADAVVERLHRVLAPEALLLAFFHPESAGSAALPSTCRILDQRHLMVRPRGFTKAAQPFNARSIERFFQRFGSVKFFMTRESVQEVVVRR